MSLDHAYERILTLEGVRVKRDELLRHHTTYRIGGPAALFTEVETTGSLSKLIAILDDEGVEWTVLGRGSNILASDAGYDGAVIILGSGFRKHEVIGENCILAGAGATLATLVRDAYKWGLSGFEFAVGIPGTLGGALAGNVGTRGEWIGEIVESVTLLEPGNGLTKVQGSDVNWSYRRSDLPDRGIIVEATLCLTANPSIDARPAMDASLARRKRTQPLSLPNAGSVFRNPEGDSAGRLIESCGLKGFTIGGAQISDMHANFIVNVNNATAADVVELVALVRNTVKKEHNVELKPEIRFLGTF